MAHLSSHDSNHEEEIKMNEGTAHKLKDDSFAGNN